MDTQSPAKRVTVKNQNGLNRMGLDRGEGGTTALPVLRVRKTVMK